MWMEATARAIPPWCVKLSVGLLRAGCPLHMPDLAVQHYLVDQVHYYVDQKPKKEQSGLSEKLVQQLFPAYFPPHQNMSLTNTKTGFSVKDILDLPDTNDEEGSITGAEEDTEGSETKSTTKNTGVLVQSPLESVQNLPLKNPFYDSSDNPYTRWLATTDSIQYSLHGLSASSQDSAKSPEPRVAVPVLVRDGKPCHTLKAQDLAATFQAGIPFSAYSAQSLQHMQYNAQYSAAATPQFPAHHLVQTQQWTW
ncbi:Homeobox protein Nkx-2.2a [Liparis tanakae]|uniref:Homeobox protein Nkx-2.2a n=1 Tax=Liparis tanakae TaxID=230148 RepID=A0A4Z2IYL9_9TELE|nr:Homeobox protein Nkx-2.2a [Liparis tanakae]